MCYDRRRQKNDPDSADVRDAEAVFLNGGAKLRCVRTLVDTFGTRGLGRKAKILILIGSVKRSSYEERAV